MCKLLSVYIEKKMEAETEINFCFVCWYNNAAHDIKDEPCKLCTQTLSKDWYWLSYVVAGPPFTTPMALFYH